MNDVTGCGNCFQ